MTNPNEETLRRIELNQRQMTRLECAIVVLEEGKTKIGDMAAMIAARAILNLAISEHEAGNEMRKARYENQSEDGPPESGEDSGDVSPASN